MRRTDATMKRVRQRCGFTLIETLLSAFLIAGTLSLNLLTLTNMSQGNAILTHRYLALQDANRVLEDLRNGVFGSPPFDVPKAAAITAQVNAGVPATYRVMDGDSESVTGESITVSVTPGSVGAFSLDTLTVSICWREARGYLVGEDANFNGIEDPGEGNGNGRIDSPVQLITRITEAAK